MPAFRAKPPKGALLNRADPLAKGLAAAWAFNEKSGLVLRDSVGRYAADGVLTNAPAWGTAEYGPALSVVAASSHSISGTSLLGSPTTISVACLYTPTTLPATSTLLGWAANSGPQFRIEGSGTLRWVRQGLADIGLGTVGAVVAGVPQMLCGSYDSLSGQFSFWVNGKPAGGGTSAQTLIYSGYSIGTRNGTEFADGKFHGVYVWGGRYLTNADAANLAADPFRLFRRRSVVLLKTAAPAGVTATAAITEAADTLSAAASVAVTATGAITESADTLTASAAVGIAATASITEAADMLSAAATVAVTASAALTEGADTLIASAVVTSGVVASANITESADTLAASASVAATATASTTERADTLAALATVVVVATAAITEGRDTLTASATVVSGIVAAAAITEGADTLSASAIVSGGGTVPGCVCATIAVANRVSFTLTVSNRVSFTLKTDCCSAA